MINPVFIGRKFRVEGRTITISEATTAADLAIVATAAPDVKISQASHVVTSTELPKLNPGKKDEPQKS